MEDAVQKEYFELLRFKSIGADPARLRDCADCALWWKKWLTKLGFTAELIMPPIEKGTAAPPIIYGKQRGVDGAPTLLIYGHYDVQPADPLDEWTTPPFEPTLKDGRVYCRGAQDDKGQSFAFLCGVRDFLTDPNSKVVPTIKVILEGQEESGSTALTRLAPDMRRRLAADVLLVCDTNAAPELRPAIVAGLRGVCHFTIRLTGPSRDLHSGEYGGIAPNPAQGIAELVASLHNADGSIAVKGFLDGIIPPTEAESAAAEASMPSSAAFTEDMGCAPEGGTRGHSLAARNAFEPTIEVNGIHSGYGGAGSKTIIPSQALAKISMRLVPGQSPSRAFEAVKTHLEANVPRGMVLSIDEWSPGAGGFRLPLASPLFHMASEILTQLDPRGPVFQWDGASIPVISLLREVSGAAPLIVGWGQPADRIHSPNESYSLEQFEKARAWGRAIVGLHSLYN